MKYICKRFINHQIKKCLLFRCRHAVVIMQTLNWTNQCPLFMTVPPYFLDQWGWPPTESLTVTHARAHWWTLDLANAFVSPGVNSRGELVPSHTISMVYRLFYLHAGCKRLLHSSSFHICEHCLAKFIYRWIIYSVLINLDQIFR
jgi:hypothetical protein